MGWQITAIIIATRVAMTTIGAGAAILTSRGRLQLLMRSPKPRLSEFCRLEGVAVLADGHRLGKKIPPGGPAKALLFRPEFQQGLSSRKSFKTLRGGLYALEP